MPDARAASVDLFNLTKDLAEGELIDAPAGLAGLFLSPLVGGTLQRLYAAERPPEQKRYSWEE